MSVKDGLTSLSHCCTDAGLQMVSWSAWWSVERRHLTTTLEKKHERSAAPARSSAVSAEALNKIQLFSEASEWSSIKITPAGNVHSYSSISPRPPPVISKPVIPPSLISPCDLHRNRHDSRSNVSPFVFYHPVCHSSFRPPRFDLRSFSHQAAASVSFSSYFGLFFFVSRSFHRGLLFSWLSESSLLIAQTLDSIQNLFLLFLF